jgi:hypothetical protein
VITHYNEQSATGYPKPADGKNDNRSQFRVIENFDTHTEVTEQKTLEVEQ